MENELQEDNHQTLKMSQSSDPHHLLKTIFIGFSALLIMAIALVIGYALGTNNKISFTQNTSQPIKLLTKEGYSIQAAPAAYNQKITPFPDIEIEITTAQLKSIPLESANNWKVISFKNISFRIPPDLTFKDLEDDSNIGIIYKEGEVGAPRISIGVKNYNGGSRRQEYFGNNYYDCNFIYEEAMFGKVNALQIAADLDLCQGGAGAIVTIVGDKLVFVGQFLQYDLGTKEILRYPLKDTIISTITSN